MILVVTSLGGCIFSDPKGDAISEATEFARNSVGDKVAAVWDTKTCWMDAKKDRIARVSGYVNGNGHGAQMFVVQMGLDGKLNGDIELAPINPVEGERVYWDEVKFIRVSDDDKTCSGWDEPGEVAVVYEQARQMGFDQLKALAEAMKFKIEMRKIRGS